MELLREIHRWQLQSIHGDLCTVLRFFLTLPATVAGGKCAFSKMKLIKIYMHSTVSQERFNGLAILSIERKLVQRLDFKDIIRDFAARKVR